MKYNVIVTNAAKNRYWAQGKAEIGKTNYQKVVTVYPDLTSHTFEGFGGAFTEAAGYSYSKLPTGKKDEFVKAYFSDDGLRYKLGRVHLNSCDFALGNYAAMNDPADAEMTSFSIERDEQYILPLIRDALKLGGLSIMATPWSPPAFMKTNGDMNNGGTLKPEYYGLWARYLAKYIKLYRDAGVPVAMLSVQNEPAAKQTWDSCLFTAEEEALLACGHIGPVLESEGLGDVTILTWDHNKELLYSRAKAYMQAGNADKYIGGFCFHWYTGDHFDALRVTRQKFPDKKLYFSEGCVEYSRFAETGAVGKAEMYAHDILGNLDAGCNGSIDWNLLLDSKGGPNHVGNFCEAPVMCNDDFTDFEKRLSYYYIGQFSRHIKPGAVHIATSRYCSEVETVAFMNPDGERVVCMLNRSEHALPVSLCEDGFDTINLALDSHSMATVIYAI